MSDGGQFHARTHDQEVFGHQDVFFEVTGTCIDGVAGGGHLHGVGDGEAGVQVIGAIPGIGTRGLYVEFGGEYGCGETQQQKGRQYTSSHENIPTGDMPPC
jgi:hypothetical protein